MNFDALYTMPAPGVGWVLTHRYTNLAWLETADVDVDVGLRDGRQPMLMEIHDGIPPLPFAGRDVFRLFLKTGG